MFEELDPMIVPLKKLIDGIEHCLYGECNDTCPFYEPDSYEHGKIRFACSQELLYQAEHYLKRYDK